MAYRRPVFATLTTVLFILLAGAVIAQVAAPTTCPDLVMQALGTVNGLCQGQGRNSACYGNYLVEAQFAADQPAGLFDAQGDIAALNALTSLRTAPFNLDPSAWGVSLLSVQANIPNSLPGQNSLFMLIGGAELESAVPESAAFAAAEPPLAIHANAEAALRERPAESEAITRTVMPGAALLADARSGDYIRVVAGDQFGWIRAAQTDADANALSGLPEFTQGASFTPMQAFYLRTGIGQPLCSQAPSALIIQGPQGLHVNIEANGADITLGSTILLRSYSVEEALRAGLPVIGSDETGGLLELIVIDGRAIVRQRDGSLLAINEGEQSVICLNNPQNLGADGRANDQTITYACGGWTAPAPIPQSVRDEFALVDDYPLIYPVDIMTPVPASQPTPTSTSAQVAGATITPSATPGTLTTTGTPESPAATNSPVPSTTPGTPGPRAVTSTAISPTATNTAVAPTATNTVVPPTATNTPVAPTATSSSALPTATNTAVAPTATSTPIAPTVTNTPVAPTATNTPIAPTATSSSALPTATSTAVVPTATNTPIAPTATNTPIAPTATSTPDDGGFRITICHNRTETLNVTLRELFNHFFADGRPQLGEHRYDYLGPCQP